MTYAAPAIADGHSGIASYTCLPASGTLFPIGPSQVKCSVSDRAGNTGSAVFGITVDGSDTLAGRMFGYGFIGEGGLHHHFVFRITQAHAREYGRMEYWVIAPRRCRFEDDRDDRVSGEQDRDYGRDHRSAADHFRTTTIERASFVDDPRIDPGRRFAAIADTVHFSGSGRWNGRSGYTFEATASDRGEPGRHRDALSLVIKNARGEIIAHISEQLDGGNVQSVR